MTILTQPQHDSKTIVDQYGTDIRVLTLSALNTGFNAAKPEVGQRYSIVLEQRVNSRVLDQLRVDRIDPDRLGHLGLNPLVGYQWGWEDGEPIELVFTVIGTYVIESFVPDLDNLTFNVLLRRETQAVSA